MGSACTLSGLDTPPLPKTPLSPQKTLSPLQTLLPQNILPPQTKQTKQTKHNQPPPDRSKLLFDSVCTLSRPHHPSQHLKPPFPNKKPTKTDRNKLLFDSVCTLSDLNYDVYHAAVDCEGEACTQLYYIRPRFGDFFWDAAKATKLRVMLESAIQRRFPKGLKVGGGLWRGGGRWGFVKGGLRGRGDGLWRGGRGGVRFPRWGLGEEGLLPPRPCLKARRRPGDGGRKSLPFRLPPQRPPIRQR